MWGIVVPCLVLVRANSHAFGKGAAVFQAGTVFILQIVGIEGKFEESVPLKVKAPANVLLFRHRAIVRVRFPSLNSVPIPLSVFVPPVVIVVRQTFRHSAFPSFRASL